MSNRQGDSSVAKGFKYLAGIRSGPAAFEGSRSCNRRLTNYIDTIANSIYVSLLLYTCILRQVKVGTTCPSSVEYYSQYYISCRFKTG